MRALRSVYVLGLGLLGCGASSRPPAATPGTVATPVPADPCGDATGLVVEAPAEIAAAWDGGSIVGGNAVVTLRWCGLGGVVVDTMTLGSADGRTASYAFDPSIARLAHGQSLSHTVLATADPGELALVVSAHDESGAAVTARRTIRSVPDPRWTAEHDACVARGGTFAPAGLAGAFACDAPTHDAGRRCLSSAECEGACIDGSIEVTTTPPDGRTCPAGQEVRLHVGTCDAHTLHFGCHPLLEAVTTECAAHGMSSRVHTVCVD